jgi:ADP-ribose pyrophosphatase YjhB (NUDIX family)
MATSSSETDAKGPWPRAGAGAVLFRGDAVLLVERGSGPSEGLWSLPGGSIEAGETAEEAARREVREECGLDADIVGLAGVYDIIDREADGTVVLHYVIATYFGRAGEGTPWAASDARDARLVSLDQLGELPTTPGTQHVIAEARRLLIASAD